MSGVVRWSPPGAPAQASPAILKTPFCVPAAPLGETIDGGSSALYDRVLPFVIHSGGLVRSLVIQKGDVMELDVMLCDHAQVAGGKLFITGANIDRMQIPAGTPAPYVINFAAAGLVRVPWTATNTEHALTFKLVTEDGQNPQLPAAAESGPQGIGGEMKFNVGRPPQLASGDDQKVPFAFNFQGLPLMTAGRYVLAFSLDGNEERRLTFTVAVQPSPGFQGTPFA